MTSPISLTAGRTLAIETSGISGSLALGAHQVDWQKKAAHSEVATVKLDELLRLAKLDLGQIEGIVVNSGPGSFTGLRVGINLARTLGYALDIPVGTLNSLQLLVAKMADRDGSCLVAIKAIQQFYYVAGYEQTPSGLKELLAPCSLEPDPLDRLKPSFAQAWIEGQSAGLHPQWMASDLLRYLDLWPKDVDFGPWAKAQPIYVRASEAEEKLLKGLLKT